MSLIILKVDRKKKTHSIYCDGIMIQGKSVISNDHCNKIRHLHNDKYDILIGNTGDVLFGVYIRINFLEELENNPIEDFSDTDMVRVKLQEIFTKLWHDFCDEKSINYKSDFSATTLLSINGHICIGEMYDDNAIGAHILNGQDYYAIGQQNSGVRAMLRLGIEPETIIDAISKENCYVNNNITSLKDIKYYD